VQLDTLNRNFQELCGEPLALKQGRGKDMLFTSTGEALVEMARRTLGDWLDEIHECRRKLGGTLTVGTTRLTLGYLARAGEHVADEFQRRGIETQSGARPNQRPARKIAGPRSRPRLRLVRRGLPQQAGHRS
jgi:hypothetical protein